MPVRTSPLLINGIHYVQINDEMATPNSAVFIAALDTDHSGPSHDHSCIFDIFEMALRTKLNVQSFPRPPLLEKVSRHIKITWNGQDILETDGAYWVLETHHPPSLVPSSFTHELSSVPSVWEVLT